MISISIDEEELEERLAKAKDQEEADKIANLVLLSKISKSLRGH